MYVRMAGTLLVSSAFSCAFAQQSSAPESAPPGAESEGQLLEIVVTAQRREENAQHAAVAIDVLSEQALVQSGVTNPDQLGSLVPALTITPAGGSRSSFFLRGVGNFTASSIFDSAIAVNYDGVYIGKPGSTDGLYYDLERIEVLEGPQGTLYGRNATGGAVNIIPAKPVAGQFSGNATVTYGNYETEDFQGAINLPLGPDGAVRISTGIAGHEGYLSDNTSDEDTKAGRVQFLYKFTDALTVRLAMDYASDRGSGTGVNYVDTYRYNRATGQYQVTPSGLGPSVGLFDPSAQAYLQTLEAGPAGRLLSPVSPYPFLNNAYYGTNAQIEWRAAAGTLTVVPAWRYGRQDNLSDTIGFLAEIQQVDKQDSLEARFVGERVGPIDYTVGGFYYEETNSAHFGIGQQALINLQALDQLTHSYAAFASVTGHVTDALRVVGGLRYTRDIKDFNGSAQNLTVVCTQAACPTAPLFPQAISTAQLPPPVPGPGQVVPYLGTGAIAVNGVTRVSGEQPTDRATYRGAVEYDVAPQSLVYGSVETGFRSGGFNIATGYDTYQPEYITAYTLGSKNRFLDNRLQLNVEAFYWKYRNQQLATVALDKAGQQSLFTQNIGRSTIAGLDTAGQVLVTPTTRLSTEVQYLHTRYATFNYQTPNQGAPPYTGCASNLDANPALYDVNCAGKPAYNAPLWTVNPGLEQTVPIGNYKVLASVDSQFRSSRYVGFEFQPAQRVGSTWTTNAQVLFGPSDDSWSIAGFVRNIEDKRFPVTENTYAIASTLVAITEPPRVFGVRASIKF